ncbi:MAG: hypothetical protein JXA64_05180 [Candidatus Fermentibacteraceae bacterium]|nr:hypothetical protein [Candidatus Fermentibacteraceae bacterium]MBN2859663.1 hypothetical protein [Sphaerochaetaceae bacterium]
MKSGILLITLALLLLISSCGQEKREATLLDSMPAGYDIYITFNPSEIDAAAILSDFREIAFDNGQQLPEPVAGILGFDPFEWDEWVGALALDPDREIGLVIAMGEFEPELITLFLPSTDADKLREFVGYLYPRIPEMEALTRIIESDGYVIFAAAQAQSFLDEFEASLETLVGTEDDFSSLRELSNGGTPAAEVFIGAAILEEEGFGSLLISCLSVESTLTLQFITRIHDIEGLEYAAAVSRKTSGNSMRVPADATAAIHVSIDMAMIKEMVSTGLPQDAQTGAAIMGFDSIDDILDIFSGDVWFALQTDGYSYSGMIAFGMNDAGALRSLIGKLTGLMDMSGEEYDSFEFQGNTCFSVDVVGLAGLASIEAGIVADAFVLSGGYTLQDVADGVSFDEYLERTGLDIADDGGFALAADIGALAAAYDLNSEAGNIIDLEEFGFVSMSGSSNEDIYEFNVSVDFGSGDPFSTLTGVFAALASTDSGMMIEEPVQDDPPPVEKDQSVDDRDGT